MIFNMCLLHEVTIWMAALVNFQFRATTLPRSKVKSIQLDFHVSAGSQADENRNWKFKLFARKGGFPWMEKASCELTGGCLLQSLENREDHFEHTVDMVKK